MHKHHRAHTDDIRVVVSNEDGALQAHVIFPGGIHTEHHQIPDNSHERFVPYADSPLRHLITAFNTTAEDLGLFSLEDLFQKVAEGAVEAALQHLSDLTQPKPPAKRRKKRTARRGHGKRT